MKKPKQYKEERGFKYKLKSVQEILTYLYMRPNSEVRYVNSREGFKIFNKK